MINFALGVAVFVGVIFAPFMTVGAIMIHFNHEILGWILIGCGVIHMFVNFLND